ncbi:MAG TPA: hypothetical protein VFW40_13090 [Capsulimonadaceae bacterium]|nr:hypothetical protein [Capsulimonadaceae bacterium]
MTRSYPKLSLVAFLGRISAGLLAASTPWLIFLPSIILADLFSGTAAKVAEAGLISHWIDPYNLAWSFFEPIMYHYDWLIWETCAIWCVIDLFRRKYGALLGLALAAGIPFLYGSYRCLLIQ